MVHREQHEERMAHEADSPAKDHSPRFKDPSPFKDAEAAHYIGMSESWLRQSRMRGNLEKRRTGRVSSSTTLPTSKSGWVGQIGPPKASGPRARVQPRPRALFQFQPINEKDIELEEAI